MNPNSPFFSDREVDDLYRVLYHNYSRMMKDFENITKVVELHRKNLVIFQKEILGLLNSNPTPEDLEKWRKNWEGMR